MKPWPVPHFLHTFNIHPYSYFYHTPYAVASFILTLVGINLYIHKASFLSLVKTACSTAASFQVFVCQYVYKLTVWNVVGVLVQSSISRSHCRCLSPSYNEVIVLFCLLLFLFCCFLAPWLLPSLHYCFCYLGCRAVLCFFLPFLMPCHFHRCCPFYRCSACNIAAFHKAGP